MRFANHGHRLTLVVNDEGGLDGARAIDVHDASGGAIPAEPELAFERWDDVLAWARRHRAPADTVIEASRLESPSPAPRQIFGIGINYADHGAEAGMERPDVPLVFTKLGTSVTGPFSAIELSTAAVDWEVELVLVIGRRASRVPAEEAWRVVAGLTAGQDLSDREIQWRPQSMPQFTLGKSLPGFAPMGPVLVTPDEFDDPSDIALACRLNGEEVQSSRTSQMLFSVPELIAYLSSVTPLLPGDVIFTGTPSGIGMTRTPPRYLAVGDRLESIVGGVGTMSNTFVTPAPDAAGRPVIDHVESTILSRGRGRTAMPNADIPNPVLHHVTLKTTRPDEMMRWYETVVGLKPNHAGPFGAWLTNDSANHRMALLLAPGLKDDPEKWAHTGMHHLAFEYPDVDGLLGTYERLKAEGITPHACLDHGLTTSMYYADPDGNSVELQVDNFGDWSASTDWMRTAPEFQTNPIGVNFDPDLLVAAWRAGDDAAELHRRSFSGEFDPGTPLDLHLPTESAVG